MDYVLDHVFVCCDPQAPEAGRLRDAGLIEGSGNVHPGQGKANRRFFFDGGFLELLWVHDPTEARSARTAPTRPWGRWRQRSEGACPFGLCLRPARADVRAPIPFDHWRCLRASLGLLLRARPPVASAADPGGRSVDSRPTPR